MVDIPSKMTTHTKKQENTIQDEKKSSIDANIRITKQGH